VPLYRVKLYDGASEPRAGHRVVNAESPLEAAEQFCGRGMLQHNGKRGQLRAVVFLMSEPETESYFYKVPL